MTTSSTPCFTMTGNAGELRYGYHVAATFGHWTVVAERGVETSIVTVSKLEPDGYWFDHHPQSLRLEVGRRSWVWRHAERIDETHYRVTGDPEVD